MAKKKELECWDCGNKYSINSVSKDPIIFCPFCGEENTECFDDSLDDDFDDENDFKEDFFGDKDEDS